jgi:hypothetical protein
MHLSTTCFVAVQSLSICALHQLLAFGRRIKSCVVPMGTLPPSTSLLR